jgi:predicted nucleic acid-binding protein
LRKAVRIEEYLRKSTNLVEATSSDFEDAWRIFKKQKETDFSFTDCTSISIMRRMNIRNLATFDRDFLKLEEVNVIGASQIIVSP